MWIVFTVRDCNDLIFVFTVFKTASPGSQEMVLIRDQIHESTQSNTSTKM